MESKVIVPTVGRVVWYWPSAADIVGGMRLASASQPFMAQVVFVHHERLVNVIVHDHSGKPHARGAVRLVQESDVYVAAEPRCEWMPYQKGQAAKTEEALRSQSHTASMFTMPISEVAAPAAPEFSHGAVEPGLARESAKDIAP